MPDHSTQTPHFQTTLEPGHYSRLDSNATIHIAPNGIRRRIPILSYDQTEIGHLLLSNRNIIVDDRGYAQISQLSRARYTHEVVERAEERIIERQTTQNTPPERVPEDYSYETTTKCRQCGTPACQWSLEITRGNRASNARAHSFPQYTFRKDTVCIYCGYDLENDRNEHITHINEIITSQPKTTSIDKMLDLLNQATNEFNNTITQEINKEKPDTGSSIIIAGKNHRRYNEAGIEGFVCSICGKISEITDNEDTPIIICPHCGTEQEPEDKNTINL